MDDLNPFFKSLLGTREVSADTLFTRFLGDASVMDRLENDIFKKTQEYHARVYESWEEDSGQTNPGNFWGLFDDEGGAGGKIVMVRARILPKPGADDCSPHDGIYPDPDKVSAELRPKAVTALPVFVGKYIDMKKPAPGTIINVSFKNKQHLKFPIYLGIAKEAQISHVAAPVSTSDAYNLGSPEEDNINKLIKQNSQKSNYKIPQVSGDVALLLGDSQMKGHLGKALAEKLKILGYTVVPSPRGRTAQAGAPINRFLASGCKEKFSGKGASRGFAGFDCIRPYLIAANRPKVVYINLSGNGGTGEQAVQLINKIRQTTGRSTPIVWLLAPRSWDTSTKKRAYLNVGPNTRGSAKGRLARNEEIKRTIQGIDGVTVIDPQAELPDYKSSETSDGLHIGYTAASRLFRNL